MPAIQPKPRQRTDYVVRAGASDSARAVYRGNSAREARSVANHHTNATITFRTTAALNAYLTGE